jgi:hypothetical protein
MTQGKGARIQQIDIRPAGTFEARFTGKGCEEGLELTPESPRCLLYLWPVKIGRNAEAGLEIEYFDIARSRMSSVELRLRANPGSQ